MPNINQKIISVLLIVSILFCFISCKRIEYENNNLQDPTSAPGGNETIVRTNVNAETSPTIPLTSPTTPNNSTFSETIPTQPSLPEAKPLPTDPFPPEMPPEELQPTEPEAIPSEPPVFDPKPTPDPEPVEPTFPEPAPTDPVPDDPPSEEPLPQPDLPSAEPEPTAPDPTEPGPSESQPMDPAPSEPDIPEPSLPEAEPVIPDVDYDVVDEIVYATTVVNIRVGPGTEYNKIGSLKRGEAIRRIAVYDCGWSKVIYNGIEAYVFSKYLSTTEPINTSVNYPLVYTDDTCTITVYREWFENAWVYAAHIQFTDYSRLGTDCANGKYKNGYETTSHAAERLNAILAINGCYSAPSLNYTVIRGGKIWNGADRSLCVPAVYSAHTGLLLSAWEGKDGDSRVKGPVQQLVDDGLVTDTFCFGPPGMINGVIKDTNSSGSRAQRTFIGTNGNAGDIWLCVSDGRYNDGESAGLTGNQCMRYLESKGCTFGVNLDGGGSSTFVWQGQVLNAADGNERKVVDFVYFK